MSAVSVCVFFLQVVSEHRGSSMLLSAAVLSVSEGGNGAELWKILIKRLLTALLRQQRDRFSTEVMTIRLKMLKQKNL